MKFCGFFFLVLYVFLCAACIWVCLSLAWGNVLWSCWRSGLCHSCGIFLPRLCLYSKFFFFLTVSCISVCSFPMFNFFSCTLLIWWVTWWSVFYLIQTVGFFSLSFLVVKCFQFLLFSLSLLQYFYCFIKFHFLVLPCLCHVCQPGASLRHLCSLSSFSLISLSCFLCVFFTSLEFF